MSLLLTWNKFKCSNVSIVDFQPVNAGKVFGKLCIKCFQQNINFVKLKADKMYELNLQKIVLTTIKIFSSSTFEVKHLSRL